MRPLRSTSRAGGWQRGGHAGRLAPVPVITLATVCERMPVAMRVVMLVASLITGTTSVMAQPLEHQSPPGLADPLAGLQIRAELSAADTPFTMGAVRLRGLVAQVQLSAPGVDRVWAAAGHRFANGWELIDVEPDAVLLLSPRGTAVRVAASRSPDGDE